MEVAGYPHYENVASNMLAFFFQPNEEHGLGDLLLASLLGAVFGEELQNWECPSDVTVHREHGTQAGGRLDLLIVAGDLVIGIENKIYHKLTNDLTDYGMLIEQMGPEGSNRIRLVLSPKPIRQHAGMEKAGFVSLSYPKLWVAVRERLGSRVHAAHNKWLNYLLDLMETTTRIAGQTGGITANDEFFIQNDQIISQLIKDRQEFLNRLNVMAKTLKDLFDEDGNTPPHQVNRWLYDGNCVVHEFISQGKNITLDLYVTMKGWQVNFFSKSEKSLAHVDELSAQPSLSLLTNNLTLIDRRYRGTVCPIQTPIEDLKQELQVWVLAISGAITSLQSTNQSPALSDVG